MKLQLITVGKLKQDYAVKGCDLFIKRLKPLCRRFELIEVRDAKRRPGGSSTAWMREEAGHIQDALRETSMWVALDERGASWTSVELAQFIERSQIHAHKSIAFVIGGPDGLDSTLRARAPKKLCLGTMTLPHELARLVLLEQLYRAHSTLANTPYHRP